MWRFTVNILIYVVPNESENCQDLRQRTVRELVHAINAVSHVAVDRVHQFAEVYGEND